MYDTTVTEQRLINICENDIDCQISSSNQPLFSLFSLMDTNIFGLCFTLSFLITTSIFFLMVMNNITELLITLMKKIDKIVLNDYRKREIMYNISKRNGVYTCVLSECNHATAKFAYVNTNTIPFGVSYFCEKHANANFKKIPITDEELPSYL